MVNEDDAENKAELYRADLARFAANKKTRSLGWPRDWRPQSVESPDSGLPFTDAGAWNLIAELLRQGVPMKEKELKNPLGQMAFVMKHILDENRAALYIKIQFGNGEIIGRSFHYSE